MKVILGEKGLVYQNVWLPEQLNFVFSFLLQNQTENQTPHRPKTEWWWYHVWRYKLR